MWKTKPNKNAKNETIENDFFSESEIRFLVDEIEDIVSYLQSGFSVDWACYDEIYKDLVKVWFEAEKQIQIIQNFRLQAFIKSFSLE